MLREPAVPRHASQTRVPALSRRLTFMALAIALPLAIGRPVAADDTFQNGFPADKGFFPIGVWQQWPGRAALFRGLGLNTVVGRYEGPQRVRGAGTGEH